MCTHTYPYSCHADQTAFALTVENKKGCRVKDFVQMP